jgi:hypothetical protein
MPSPQLFDLILFDPLISNSLKIYKQKKQVNLDLFSSVAPSNLILSNQFITDLKRLNVLYDFITNDIAG